MRNIVMMIYGSSKVYDDNIIKLSGWIDNAQKRCVITSTVLSCCQQMISQFFNL